MKSAFKAIAVIALATSSLVSVARAADSIVGSWQLVSWIEEETESKAVHKNFGDHLSNATLFANAGCFRKMKCKHGNAMCKWQRKLVRGTSWRARAWGQHVSFQKHPLKTRIRLLSPDGKCRLCD